MKRVFEKNNSHVSFRFPILNLEQHRILQIFKNVDFI